jgi:alpha-ribazole phosphatase
MKRLSRLYLVRHGQVIGYDQFPVYGHTDVDLTEVGLGQTEHLAQRLRLTGIGAIYSSDLKRSVGGARIIARHHDVALHVMPELRELFFGVWEGLSLSDIRERFPEELEKRQADPLDYRPPGGGESIAALSKRIMGCFSGILEEQHENDFVLVGHGAVNRIILCNAMGLDLLRLFSIHQDYGCLNIIDYFPDSTLVRLMNG